MTIEIKWQDVEVGSGVHLKVAQNRCETPRYFALLPTGEVIYAVINRTASGGVHTSTYRNKDGLWADAGSGRHFFPTQFHTQNSRLEQ